MKWWVLLLVVLAACTQLPVEPYDPWEPPEEPDLRPDIPRTYVPEDETIPVEQPGSDQPIFLPEVEIPGLTLDLQMYEPIGEAHPVIRAVDFPLLRHKVVPLSPGEYAEYIEEVVFDFDENNTGEIIFGIDDHKEVGTFLRFKNEKPVMGYYVRLLGGFHWQDIGGRDIQLLGNTYVIADVSNSSVNFYGRDIEGNMIFSNDSKLVVNSDGVPDTEVYVDQDELFVTWYADSSDRDGEIWLSPGESLREHIPGFANSLLDLRYEGLYDASVTHVEFDKTQHGYDMTIETADGMLEISLVEEDGGVLMLGRLDEPLRIEECKGSDYCITPGERLLFTARDGRTFLASYEDVSDNPQELIFRNNNNRYSYEFIGEFGRNAWADVVLGGEAFRAEIGDFDNDTDTANISVDFRHYRDANAVLLGGFEVHIENIVNNNTLPIEIEIPRELTFDRKKESLFVNITYDGSWKVTVGGNLTFVEQENTDDVLAQLPYGAVALLDKKRESLEVNEAIEVDILLPHGEALGRVRLEG